MADWNEGFDDDFGLEGDDAFVSSKSTIPAGAPQYHVHRPTAMTDMDAGADPFAMEDSHAVHSPFFLEEDDHLGFDALDKEGVAESPSANGMGAINRNLVNIVTSVVDTPRDQLPKSDLPTTMADGAARVTMDSLLRDSILRRFRGGRRKQNSPANNPPQGHHPHGDSVGSVDAIQQMSSAAPSKGSTSHRRSVWSPEDDEKFYDALARFGVNLALITVHFPGRTRAEINAKYKIEMRRNRARVISVAYSQENAKEIDLEEFERVQHQYARHQMEQGKEKLTSEEEALLESMRSNQTSNKTSHNTTPALTDGGQYPSSKKTSLNSSAEASPGQIGQIDGSQHKNSIERSNSEPRVMSAREPNVHVHDDDDDFDLGGEAELGRSSDYDRPIPAQHTNNAAAQSNSEHNDENTFLFSASDTGGPVNGSDDTPFVTLLQQKLMAQHQASIVTEVEDETGQRTGENTCSNEYPLLRPKRPREEFVQPFDADFDL